MVTKVKPQLKEDQPTDQFLQNMKVMDSIVRQMKEIPELPSEAVNPNDSNALTKVEFPDTGGILTYMDGHDQPYRGFPYFEFVEKIDLMKKVSRGLLSGMYHELKARNKLMFLTLLPAMWFAKPLVRSGIYLFYRIIERFKIKRQIYSQPIRELHRAFSVDRKGESKGEKEMRLQLRDLLCMVLEFDNAYRFRLQDTLQELDKGNVQKSVPKEINRLLSIMQSREKGMEVFNSWKLLKIFLVNYLRFDKELRTLLRDVLLELNLEEMKLSKEDTHYCTPRKDYTFGSVQK